MNWQKVIDDLKKQAEDAVRHAEELRRIQPEEHYPPNLPGGLVVELRWKTIERHRINANFCFALAQALEAGIE